jgi:hypothetical protein
MRLRVFATLTLLVAAPLGAPAAEPEDVAINVKGNQIDFTAGKMLVGRYNKGPEVAKPYFWPLHATTGVPITRAWPMMKGQPGESTDHVHQKSFWFCHGDVIPEGIELKDKVKNVDGVDFWAESKGHGRIVCTKVEAPKSDKNHAWVATHNEWRTADGTKVMDEGRTIHLYDLGDAKLFVFDIDLHASVCPITFGDTKEGSFGIRVNDAICEQMVVNKKRVKMAGKLENAEGKVGEKECWGQVSAWCDYSGPLEGKVVGLAILADPSNPVPTCWHARGYGLMAANPFGRARSGFPAMKDKPDLVKLAKGEHLKLRYGLLLHSGDAKEGKVADYFPRFVKLRG